MPAPPFPDRHGPGLSRFPAAAGPVDPAATVRAIWADWEVVLGRTYRGFGRPRALLMVLRTGPHWVSLPVCLATPWRLLSVSAQQSRVHDGLDRAVHRARGATGFLDHLVDEHRDCTGLGATDAMLERALLCRVTYRALMAAQVDAGDELAAAQTLEALAGPRLPPPRR